MNVSGSELSKSEEVGLLVNFDLDHPTFLVQEYETGFYLKSREDSNVVRELCISDKNPDKKTTISNENYCGT